MPAPDLVGGRKVNVMGWYFTTGATQQDIIRERIASWESEETGAKSVTLKHCLVGNVLWTVREIANERQGFSQRYIGCDLLQASREGWGYKPMEEDMGPCYYTCPLAYLDLAGPTSSKWAQEWRGKVRAHHAGSMRNP